MAEQNERAGEKAAQFSLSLLVLNHAGTLSRIAELFSRRGYNIDFLSVGATKDPVYANMTIVTTGDESVKEQMIKQLEKLHDVKKVMLMEFSI